MPINYKQLLLSAVQIVLHNKYLWFFGLFSAFLASGVGYRANKGDFTVNFERLQSTGIFDMSIFGNIIELAKANPTGFLLQASVLVAVIALTLFLVWLALVSQGALIHSTAKLDLNKRTDFSDGLVAGKKHFWPVLFFRITEKIITVILVSLILVSALGFLSLSGSIALRLLYFVLASIIVAAVFLAALAIRYAISYQVIKDMRFIDSLRSGFWLLKRNFLASVEAGLVVFVISFILGFLVLMLLSALFIPFAFLVALFNKLAFSAGLIFILIAGIVGLFALIIVVGGILGAFIDIYWTLIFVRVAKNNPRSVVTSLLIGK